MGPGWIWGSLGRKAQASLWGGWGGAGGTPLRSPALARSWRRPIPSQETRSVLSRYPGRQEQR